MLKKIKLLFSPPNVLVKLIQLRWRGMLYEEGWFEAACYYKSVNKNLEPIPWWSYSFNDFFLPFLNKELVFFEYGSGNSTLYLSKYIKEITSIEHNKAYFESLKNKVDNNVILKFVKLDKYGGEYSKSILNENKLFDVIIVDGRDRVNSVYNCLDRLKDNGVIILDDSQRDNYKPAIDFLKNKGFKHIYFSGVSAGTYKKKYTSLFYKDDNWIGL